MASCLSTGNIFSFGLTYYIFTKNILAKICETVAMGKGFKLSHSLVTTTMMTTMMMTTTMMNC